MLPIRETATLQRIVEYCRIFWLIIEFSSGIVVNSAKFCSAAKFDGLEKLEFKSVIVQYFQDITTCGQFSELLAFLVTFEHI